ncbi:MAG TPA: SLC13 family permease [Thermoanaerobaculia bacterium]|nr:SLC13 family permease [Thermoanaerobaculia bacterium]
MDQTLVLVLAPLVVLLLAKEWASLEVVALGLIVVLAASGILTPTEALAGFGSEAVLAIASLFVLTAGIQRSGLLEDLGKHLERLAARGPRLLAATHHGVVAAVSSVVSNTACTATFIPVTLALARASKTPAAHLLMPLAFASMLGGSLTLIGTSTNLIVSSFLASHDLPPLGMFEMLPVAAPIALLGLLYLTFAAPLLLPSRGEPELEQAYSLRSYLSEVRVLPGSPLSDRTITEADIGQRWRVQLLSVTRASLSMPPAPEATLLTGDLLLVEGASHDLAKMARERGLELSAEGVGLPEVVGGQRLELVEVLLLPRSGIAGRTLAQSGFRQRWGARVLALYRHGEAQAHRLGEERLRVGDVLLVQGDAPAIERLASQPGLLVLSRRSPPARHARVSALIVLIAVVALASLGVLATLPALLLGCWLLLLTRALTAEEAYRAIDWRLLVLIAGMIAYGRAFETTGAAGTIAEAVTGALGGLGVYGLLGGIYLITMLLTQAMSNQAAALVTLPVALTAAAEAGIDPRAAAVTVALAASHSFLTPLEPSCLLVASPGRYRFSDFPRLGLALTAMAMAITVALVPEFWSG